MHCLEKDRNRDRTYRTSWTVSLEQSKAKAGLSWTACGKDQLGPALGPKDELGGCDGRGGAGRLLEADEEELANVVPVLDPRPPYSALCRTRAGHDNEDGE